MSTRVDRMYYDYQTYLIWKENGHDEGIDGRLVKAFTQRNVGTTKRAICDAWALTVGGERALRFLKFYERKQARTIRSRDLHDIYYKRFDHDLADMTMEQLEDWLTIYDRVIKYVLPS